VAQDVVFEIPGTFTCRWDAPSRSIIGTWHSFRTAKVAEIVTRHLTEGGNRGAKTCVVDVSEIKGVLAPEDATWVEKNGSVLAAKAGIAAIVNVVPASALTKMGADRWLKAVSSNGVGAYTCASIEDAQQIARNVLAGK
jgi:hypothetical protein